MFRLNLSHAAALLSLSAIACFAAGAGSPVSAAGPKDIVDTAVGAGSFKTLVAAVQAAGLVETLKGKGPFTVFAPTDEAFQKLEAAKPGTLASLLKPENKKTLAGILTYHVLPGKVGAADVLKLHSGAKVKTANGQSVSVRNEKGVQINNAEVIKTDIECSNGVIHVIDTVLLPKAH